jgi:chromosome segregation ATPase
MMNPFPEFPTAGLPPLESRQLTIEERLQVLERDNVNRNIHLFNLDEVVKANTFYVDSLRESVNVLFRQQSEIEYAQGKNLEIVQTDFNTRLDNFHRRISECHTRLDNFHRRISECQRKTDKNEAEIEDIHEQMRVIDLLANNTHEETEKQTNQIQRNSDGQKDLGARLDEFHIRLANCEHDRPKAELREYEDFNQMTFNHRLDCLYQRLLECKSITDWNQAAIEKMSQQTKMIDSLSGDIDSIYEETKKNGKQFERSMGRMNELETAMKNMRSQLGLNGDDDVMTRLHQCEQNVENIENMMEMVPRDEIQPSICQNTAHEYCELARKISVLGQTVENLKSSMKSAHQLFDYDIHTLEDRSTLCEDNIRSITAHLEFSPCDEKETGYSKIGYLKQESDGWSDDEAMEEWSSPYREMAASMVRKLTEEERRVRKMDEDAIDDIDDWFMNGMKPEPTEEQVSPLMTAAKTWLSELTHDLKKMSYIPAGRVDFDDQDESQDESQDNQDEEDQDNDQDNDQEDLEYARMYNKHPQNYLTCPIAQTLSEYLYDANFPTL